MPINRNGQKTGKSHNRSQVHCRNNPIRSFGWSKLPHPQKLKGQKINEETGEKNPHITNSYQQKRNAPPNCLQEWPPFETLRIDSNLFGALRADDVWHNLITNNTTDCGFRGRKWDL